MTAYDEAASTAIESLQRLKDCLDSDKDIRKCFSLLPAVAFPFKGLIDISTKPDEMFMAYMIIDQLGNVQSAYDGNSDRWYEINADNVKQLRMHLRKLTEDVVEPLKKKNRIELLNSLQDFWVNFHKLARRLSSDHR
jgi:hypothetical protein